MMKVLRLISVRRNLVCQNKGRTEVEDAGEKGAVEDLSA